MSYCIFLLLSGAHYSQVGGREQCFPQPPRDDVSDEDREASG